MLRICCRNLNLYYRFSLSPRNTFNSHPLMPDYSNIKLPHMMAYTIPYMAQSKALQ